jgi:hypothetical protein
VNWSCAAAPFKLAAATGSASEGVVLHIVIVISAAVRRLRMAFLPSSLRYEIGLRAQLASDAAAATHSENRPSVLN